MLIKDFVKKIQSYKKAKKDDKAGKLSFHLALEDKDLYSPYSNGLESVLELTDQDLQYFYDKYYLKLPEELNNRIELLKQEYYSLQK